MAVVGDGCVRAGPGIAGARPRTLDVSVVIPTIGRPELLASGLRSILACEPGPAEIIVVDQSDADATAEVVAACADTRVRRVACDGRGAARARNTGLRAATCDVVLFTDDDCRAAPDWVGVAHAHMAAWPTGIVTGRVLPAEGGVGAVPSTITTEQPQDWTGVLSRGALYSGNMAGPRAALREVGPFDVRPSLRFAAEDNDLCFRWIRSGGALRYAPDMVVWHEDWRSPPEMAAVHARYSRGQGAFYAKHLLRGDRVVARFVVEDLRRGVRARLRRVVRGNSVVAGDLTVPRVSWMLVGLAHGLVDACVLASRRSARR